MEDAHIDSRPIRFRSRFEEDVEGVYTLGLALVDDNQFDNTNVPHCRTISLQGKRTKCERLEARLRSKCLGLLEVQRLPAHFTRWNPQCCFCGHARDDRKSPDRLFDSTVQFIHRSVFEFLNNPSVWDLDCLHIDDAAYEASAALSMMTLHLLCIRAVEEEPQFPIFTDNLPLNEMARECLLCAKSSDSAFGEATPRTLLNASVIIFELIEVLGRRDFLTTGDGLRYRFFRRGRETSSPF